MCCLIIFLITLTFLLKACSLLANFVLIWIVFLLHVTLCSCFPCRELCAVMGVRWRQMSIALEHSFTVERYTYHADLLLPLFTRSGCLRGVAAACSELELVLLVVDLLLVCLQRRCFLCLQNVFCFCFSFKAHLKVYDDFRISLNSVIPPSRVCLRVCV